MANRLEGRVAIVTGAAKGIGLATAQLFADEGARVVVADRDEDLGRAFAAQLPVGVFARTDVTDRDSCRAAAKAALDQFGRIDVLCHNAGIYPETPLDEMTEADWDLVIDVDLKGMFYMVKEVLPAMRQQKYGRIVMTSSITGPCVGFPGSSHYGAAKAGMVGFMRTAALEMAADNITINAILPGNTLTEGAKAHLTDEQIQSIERGVPMGRFARPLDIAFGMLYLASDEASYVTGQTLVIDGGQVLPESVLAM